MMMGILEVFFYCRSYGDIVLFGTEKKHYYLYIFFIPNILWVYI